MPVTAGIEVADAIKLGGDGRVPGSPPLLGGCSSQRGTPGVGVTASGKGLRTPKDRCGPRSDKRSQTLALTLRALQAGHLLQRPELTRFCVQLLPALAAAPGVPRALQAGIRRGGS